MTETTKGDLMLKRILIVSGICVITAGCVTTEQLTRSDLDDYYVESYTFIEYTTNNMFQVNSPTIDDLDIESNNIIVSFELKKESLFEAKVTSDGDIFSKNVEVIDFYQLPQNDQVILSFRTDNLSSQSEYINNTASLPIELIKDSWKNSKKIIVYIDEAEIGEINVVELTSELKKELDSALALYNTPSAEFVIDKSLTGLNRLLLLSSIINNVDYMKFIEDQIKLTKMNKEIISTKVANFTHYYDESNLKKTFDDLNNPYAFSETACYYLSHVVPILWIDDEIFQAKATFVNIGGDEYSPLFYINLGKYKASEISNNSVLGTDFGQNYILTSKGEYLNAPLFELIHIFED